ncbi:MAG: esterase-like activity of phytase family protein [Candidatus Binatia bacterium]
MVLGVLLVDPGAAAAGEMTRHWNLETLREPSGLVYHPGRGSLFVAGDEGDVAEVSVKGELLAMERLGGDLEGITCDPSTGFLYVVREGEDEIVELDPEGLKPLRRFSLDRAFEEDADFVRRGGDGLEGITFVPSPESAEGGSFFAVNQNDPAVILELGLPLRSSSVNGTARIKAAYQIESSPLSGIVWLPDENVFLVTSALWGRVDLVERAGKKVGSFRVPGFLPEGLALVPGGRFVIAQDTGGLIEWTPDKDPVATLIGEADAGTKVTNK